MIECNNIKKYKNSWSNKNQYLILINIDCDYINIHYLLLYNINQYYINIHFLLLYAVNIYYINIHYL